MKFFRFFQKPAKNVPHHKIHQCITLNLGSNEYKEASEYVRIRFLKIFEAYEAQKPINTRKTMHIHFTNALDTRNIDRVVESCIDVILKMAIQNAGLE